MHRLVPEFIIKQYASERTGGGFQAAGLFVDISGFSTITDALMAHGQHGAEVMAVLMRSVFAPLVHSVYEQGGFITTFAGDAFTVLFPLADVHQEGPWRVLYAAQRIQEHMAGAREQDTPYGTFQVAAKVGLAVGDVNWGIVSSENGERAVYYFRGSAIDECAGAEHVANAGDIIVTRDLYTAVRDLVVAEPVASTNGVADHFRLIELRGPLPLPQMVELSPINREIAARFYPEALVTQQRSGEFRDAVNLFIRLPTVRTETQLGMFMQSLFALQDRYGGLLSRLDFGDKGSNVLLFWGAPVAYETDIERALNFILDLQTQTSIPINAGVTYRIAHAGFVGAPLREEYTCYGRGVNLAARFMTAAPRGEIWVDEGVARRAEHRFDLEFEGEMAFKGFGEEQKVYALLEPKDDVESFFQGELVGREEELAQLIDFVEPLWNGQYAGAVVIRGEPGIGKSRLVDALRRELSANAEPDGIEAGLSWFLCQADEIYRESLNPFRYWLSSYLGLSEAQTEARNKRSFNRTLDHLIGITQDDTLVGELDRTRSFLGALVGLRWPDSLYEQLDPQGRYENTLIGLTTLIQAESVRQPVVIHLEDAHWLDDDSRTFLARLTRTLTADERRAYPIALVVTARQSGIEPLLGEGLDYREIDLAQLSRDDLVGLAGGQLDGMPAPALLDLLAERSAGNPFFAEQILFYLQERDLLTLSDDGWRLAAGTRVNLLPTDVRAVLVARMDQLTQEVKDVVQAASVLGKEFEVQLLARMMQDERVLSERVAEAEQAAIWSALSQLRYLFKHGLVRDTAYRIQVRARRQVLHRLAVEALENLYASDLSAQYGELAYHSELAGLDEKAIRYLWLAGDIAGRAYQNSQALDYYGRALNLVPDADLVTRWELLLAREQVNDLLGDRDAQRADLQTLEMLAAQLDDDDKRAEVTLRQSEFAFDMAEYDAAIIAAKRAVILAQSLRKAAKEAAGHRLWGAALREQGDYAAARSEYEISREQAQKANAKAVWARSLHDLGSVARLQMDYPEARLQHEQALGLYRQVGDRRGEGLCLRALGIVANNLTDHAGARGFVEHALGIAREIGDRQLESDCYNTLAHLAQREWDLSGAQGYLERALGMYRQLADRRWEGLCLSNLGYVAWAQGDYSGADSHLRLALAIVREIGDKWDESLCLENLGMVNRDIGEYAGAQAYLRRGLALCREIGLREREGLMLNELGIVTADLRQYGETQAVFGQALALRRELGKADHVAETLAGLANLSQAKGDCDRAQLYINEVLASLEGNPGLLEAERPFRVHLICYQVLRCCGDERAEPVLRRAYDLLQVRAAKIPDETTRRSFLRNVAPHAEIVRIYEDLSEI